MAGAARIRPAQIEKARKLLLGLPVKDDGKTKEEAVMLLAKDFQKAMKKGYGPKEISELLRREGIVLPTSMLKEYAIDAPMNPTPKKEDANTAEAAEKMKTPPRKGTLHVTPDTPDEDL